MTELFLDGGRIIPDAVRSAYGWEPLVPHPSLAVNISVMLVRVERGRCAMCGLRRVRFRLQANTSNASEAVCAKCAGMRA